MTQPDSFETWRKGFGPIVHSDETIERVRALAATTGVGAETLYRILIAADRLAGAAMWTVVHMSYAERVDLSGAPLPADAFKTTPEGPTGGALNMVPARSDEPTSELQSLIRISYPVFSLKKKK